MMEAGPELGFTVLGSIVGLLALLAVIVTYGKKFYEEKRENKDS
jgi:hypothetical protein